MARICDLHIHSDLSDSDMPVEEIFKTAVDNKVDCISLTDHDTLDGIDSAFRCSKKYDIEFIPGIEISAQHFDSEIHILGFFIDHLNKKFLDILAEMRVLRIQRLVEMVDKLNELGVAVSKPDFLEFIKGVVPTRLHLAIYLIQRGYTRDMKETFDKYIGVNKPAYSGGFKYSVKEVIAAIRDAGGLSFIAHPHMLTDQRLVEEFIGYGLDGIEVQYRNMPQRLRTVYDKYVFEKKLLRCGGSDAHGSYKKYAAIGSVNIPYDWVQEMKERLENND
ncbi:MAG: PHP domain-containing protein [Candidatus Omnitrophica bacterium]|nr:PHP domain-containing protein [Candidatus Omnitrophota bacterium]MDD5080791.1 PHP domain-containing protein [Candidatus Omnitrophota bacterium]